jgi:hypothetical protein
VAIEEEVLALHGTNARPNVHSHPTHDPGAPLLAALLPLPRTRGNVAVGTSRSYTVWTMTSTAEAAGYLARTSSRVMNGTLQLLAVAVASIVVAVPWVRVAHTLNKPAAIPSTARPTAFVWGDRVFWRTHPFAAWLRAHGRNYPAWARTHPAADALLRRNSR